MLWEHEPQASVPQLFRESSCQQLVLVLVLVARARASSERRQQLVLVSPSSYRNTIFNQSARVFS